MAWGVLSFLRSSEAGIRVSSACRFARHRGFALAYIPVMDWQELFSESRARPGRIAVVDPYDPDGIELERLEELACIVPSELIVVYARFSGRPVGIDIPRILEVGITRIVTAGVDDMASELADVIVRTLAASRPLSTFDTSQLTLRQQMLLKWSERRGGGPVSVSSVAGRIGASPRTLRRWCDDLEGVSALDLLRWGQILQGARLLADPDVTISAVSSILGFSGSSVFRRTFRTLTGFPISTVRRDELPGAVERAFASAMTGAQTETQ